MRTRDDLGLVHRWCVDEGGIGTVLGAVVVGQRSGVPDDGRSGVGGGTDYGQVAEAVVLLVVVGCGVLGARRAGRWDPVRRAGPTRRISVRVVGAPRLTRGGVAVGAHARADAKWPATAGQMHSTRPQYGQTGTMVVMRVNMPCRSQDSVRTG
ncbi:hypothetical protein ACFWZT_25145 [Streptomyces alboflavus]|uniref:hypothetical protein n=1 Tax=Streptomyces alboflavus TaxID=67267 RepID=UPI0036913D86